MVTREYNYLNFFTYLKSRVVRRIPLSRELQEKLSIRFLDKAKKYVPDDTEQIINFQENPEYKPDKEQVFVLEEFDLPNTIESALLTPTAVPPLQEREYNTIRAVFCGRYSKDNSIVIFTNFDSRNIISKGGHKHLLMHSKETFTEFKNDVIVLDERVDCFYLAGSLYFKSKTNAKKIFGETIAEYYREASEDEIKEFAMSVFGNQEIPDSFLNSRTNRLIFGALSNIDSIDLENLVEVARNEFNLNLEFTDDKRFIKVPKDKKTFRRLLMLLNDDLLESPLTNTKYETNSKRRIS